MGFLEIAIVALILLIFFGYRMLPALGRSAGEGVNQLKDSTQEIVGDKLDPSTLGRSAGRGVREVREFKELVSGRAENEKEQAPPGTAQSEEASPAPPGESPDSRETAGS